MELTISADYLVAGSQSFVFDNLQYPLRIGVGQRIQFGVTFTAPQVPGVVATETVEFASNDPNSPRTRLEIRAATTGSIRVVTNDFISFVNPQLTDTRILEIQNLGDVPAAISAIRFEDGTLFQLVAPPQFPLTINPGQKAAVTIGLKQLPPSGVYFDTVHVLSNDLRRPDIRVGLELRR